MRLQAAYEELLKRVREQTTLASCSALLGWDEQTYMPRGGGEHRGNQLALLAGLHHEMVTHPRVGELLGELDGFAAASTDSPEAANIREIARGFQRFSLMPRSLVEELARVTSLAQQEWAEARKQSDFPRLRPWLEAIFALKRSEAACLGYAERPYNALLDEYEPGATAAGLATVFKPLCGEIVSLRDEIMGCGRKPDGSILKRDFPVDKQRVFSEMVAKAVGFDFDKGRIDLTAHPFCSQVGPGDCRVATRYDARNFGDGFFGVLHEVGHGLYDQGLNPAHYGTPLGEACSLGMHESQSRLWENIVGRSRMFWRHWFPRAQQVFHEALRDVSLEDFHFAINLVEPSLNRVEADEVTYNLHIFVRFELERALIDGDLAVGDIPGAWSEAYARYLGVSPANDAEGCLQDIHWSAGLIGYFPTYTLGNVFAAQLFDAARYDLGDLDAAIAAGECAGLLGWLQDRIHRHGQRYRAADLIERATGSRPSHVPLVQSLREKYSQLYL